MMLRDYQSRAVTAVEQLLPHGSVCLVAPTGAGKTVMMAALKPHLVIVHRRELLDQARARIPGTQVRTVQQLLISGDRPAAARVAWDECHHYAAQEWGSVRDAYQHADHIGVTATPQRSDGRPLGDCYKHLVVAASYSELLESGHLCECRVLRPPEALDRGLALTPLEAYQRHAEHSRCIVYVGTKRDAARVAREFTEAGYPAAAITDDTKADIRSEAIRRFRDGDLTVLVNVYTLTEGLDVPEVSCIILARQCSSEAMFLQIAGRGLRPAPGKEKLTLLDLVGATLEHGLPTEDRAYSLSGKAITRASVCGVRNCLQCGACYESSRLVCPECGWQPLVKNRPPPKIWSLELTEVYAGEDTPSGAKRVELRRLLELCMEKGWGLGWAVQEYERLFGEKPREAELKRACTNDERQEWYAKLRSEAMRRGFKPGWASHRYKTVFGTWPRKS